MTRKTWILMLAVMVTAGFLAGCEKFTRARYDTITPGLSEMDVQQTLGEPTARFSDSWTYIHDNPFYKAIIKFDSSGKVKDKAWYDESEMGEHPDLKDQPGAGSGSVILQQGPVVK